MKLVYCDRPPRLANALRRHFACDCGAVDEDIVAERTWVSPAHTVPKVA